MSVRHDTDSKAVPAPSSIPEIKVGDRLIEPKVESLKQARSMLLAEYGPCAASHPELLMATARRLEQDARRPDRSE